MKPLAKATVVALIQVLIVCSLGAKLLYDRHTRPQAWFLAERYDPNLPIRGRYLSLQIEVNDPRSPEELQQRFGNEIRMWESQQTQSRFRFYEFGKECGSVVVRAGIPVAEFDNGPNWDCENLAFTRRTVNSTTRLKISEPILFFISDTAKDPSHLQTGEELWVLATIPRKGPPRPVALGIKKQGNTAITPLGLD